MILQDYIEQEIIPYYQDFDKAHNINHVRAVIERSIELASQFQANIDMAYTIAAYHDTGLRYDRKLHHIISGEILASDKQLQEWFDNEQINIMRQAVEDHRASSDHKPRSIYGCIVAEADRLIDPDLTLRRTIQYGLQHLDSPHREIHYNRFCKHLNEKYSEGGYLQLWLPNTDNSRKLQELREIIADKERLRCIFDQIFDEENSQ